LTDHTVDVQPPPVFQYLPFGKRNHQLSLPFRLSLHVVGNPTWLMQLFPRTTRRENRCPLTALAHFYTSDCHENLWAYRFRRSEQDAGNSKKNGSAVRPQLTKYTSILPLCGMLVECHWQNQGESEIWFTLNAFRDQSKA